MNSVEHHFGVTFKRTHDGTRLRIEGSDKAPDLWEMVALVLYELKSLRQEVAHMRGRQFVSGGRGTTEHPCAGGCGRAVAVAGYPGVDAKIWCPKCQADRPHPILGDLKPKPWGRTVRLYDAAVEDQEQT